MKLSLTPSTLGHIMKNVLLLSFAWVIIGSAWAANALFNQKRDFNGTPALVGVSTFKPSLALPQKLTENKQPAEQIGVGKSRSKISLS